MSAGLNQITILGRLGNDPITRDTRTETTVTHFDVTPPPDPAQRAVLLGPFNGLMAFLTKAGDKVEKVTWFRCEAWNGRGKAIAQYLGKGNRLLINGRIDFRQYEKTVGEGERAIAIKVPDPILIVEDFKIIDWKDDNPSDGFDQEEV